MIKLNNRFFVLVAVCPFLLSFTACCKKPDLEKERLTLLELHKEQEVAHLNKDANLFVDQFADKMVSVKGGKISTTSKDSTLLRFQNYFDKVEIREWTDINPPRIDFSTDASMAYVIVDKLVLLTYKNAENNLIEEITHFAWVSIFKKSKREGWKLVCNVSTNEPEIKK
ncbi:MAG: hypothetical protein IPJ09_15305 [Saprospiraceae bacterium]|nr:hypothetical protein [Saprospiraceae bacterium]